MSHTSASISIDFSQAFPASNTTDAAAIVSSLAASNVYQNNFFEFLRQELGLVGLEGDKYWSNPNFDPSVLSNDAAKLDRLIHVICSLSFLNKTRLLTILTELLLDNGYVQKYNAATLATIKSQLVAAGATLPVASNDSNISASVSTNTALEVAQTAAAGTSTEAGDRGETFSVEADVVAELQELEDIQLAQAIAESGLSGANEDSTSQVSASVSTNTAPLIIKPTIEVDLPNNLFPLKSNSSTGAVSASPVASTDVTIGWFGRGVLGALSGIAGYFGMPWIASKLAYAVLFHAAAPVVAAVTAFILGASIARYVKSALVSIANGVKSVFGYGKAVPSAAKETKTVLAQETVKVEVSTKAFTPVSEIASSRLSSSVAATDVALQLVFKLKN